uniref:Uncharacterized protein MANES_04G148600 n=1 Tax=Rhizophora mucronata TaxID=61149 RepID=A0A2P2PIP6_RHIMU
MCLVAHQMITRIKRWTVVQPV